eukprot:Hpha_TRINITY_DN16904_c0_g1::TRINITY_DN16904_c0_g1_i1::g.54529::m.54529
MASGKWGEMAKKWWLGCSGWIMRKSDSEEDVRIKRTITPLTMLSVPLSLYQLIYGVVDLQNSTYVVAMGIYLMTYAIYFGGGLLGKNMGKVIDLCLLLLAIANVVYDSYNAAAVEQRNWSLVVVYLDVALVLDRMRPVSAMIVVTLTWLFVANIESAFRFGLYDEISAARPPVCDCLDPPCTTSFIGNIAAWTVGAMVLLFDFHLTRGFATNLRLQLRRVNSSVNVAAQVAAALARYDTSTAEGAIAEGADLPPELRDAFRQMIHNLKVYKPYLPHSCLLGETDSLPDEYIPPPESADKTLFVDPPELRSPIHGMEEVMTPPEGPQASQRSPPSGSTSLADHSIRGLHLPGVPPLPSPLEMSLSMSVSSRRVAARRARVSLAVSNKIGYLKSADNLAGAANSNWIADDVERWQSAVVETRGVVDLVGGDRRYASFNARQRCDNHAAAAMNVLSKRYDAEWSGCVVTGLAVCGDFGSSDVLRFMVLGGMASSLHPLERTAARWGINVLADGEAFSAAFASWEGKLLGCVFIPKRGAGPLRLYSITGRRDQAQQQGPEEWMYELENMPKGEHHAANEAQEVLIRSSLDEIRAATTEPSTDEVGGCVVWRITEVGLYKCC